MKDHSKMPVGFVAHGSPTLALDPVKGADLQRWFDRRPRAVLVVSAHWEEAPPTIGTTKTRELMYDFYGFPKPLYELEYPAPGAPEVASDVEKRLRAAGVPVARDDRPLDHGVWVPMLHMAPEADIPIVQLSMPSDWGPDRLFELGRTLAPLRDEGIYILGSGNLVHNLRRIDWSESGEIPAWATEFDDWAKNTLESGDFDGLRDFTAKSPSLQIAHPTVEHFLPVLVTAGAASRGFGEVRTRVEGFEFGSISRRSIEFV